MSKEYGISVYKIVTASKTFNVVAESEDEAYEMAEEMADVLDDEEWNDDGELEYECYLESVREID